MPNPTTGLPTVYIYAAHQFAGDHSVYAIADDGEVLATHICSAPGFFRGDLHDREYRHAAYERKYGAWGDGGAYRVEVLDVGSTPPAEVLERNKALAADAAGPDA